MVNNEMAMDMDRNMDMNIEMNTWTRIRIMDKKMSTDI
jgi:hypothetical protein